MILGRGQMRTDRAMVIPKSKSSTLRTVRLPRMRGSMGGCAWEKWSGLRVRFIVALYVRHK